MDLSWQSHDTTRGLLRLDMSESVAQWIVQYTNKECIESSILTDFVFGILERTRWRRYGWV